MTRAETFSRRSLMGGGLAAGLALTPLALSGCSGGGSRLRAAWWGSNTLNKAVKSVLSAYAKTHDLTISTEANPWDGYWDKLATETAGGNPPDLMMMAASHIPEYASNKTLLALDSYVGKDLVVSNLDEGIVDFGKLDGKLYGIIAATNALGVVTNSDVFDHLGLTPPSDGMPWDDFGTLATKVHKASSGKMYGLQDAGGDLVSFDVWSREQGTDLFDADGKLAPTEADFTRWFTWWDNLRKNGGVVPAQISSQAQGKINASGLVTDKAAMGIGWTQDYVSYASLMKASLAMKLMPMAGDQEGNWINAASLWSVSAKSKHADTIVKLISHILNDDAAEKTLSNILGGPPTKKARELILPGLEGAEKASVEFMDKIADHSRPLNRLWPPAFSPLRTEFTRINEAIAFKKSSVEKGVADFFAYAAKNKAA